MFGFRRRKMVTRKINLAKDFAEASRPYKDAPEIQSESNCYTYALGIAEHGHACPGMLHQMTGSHNALDDDEITPKRIYNRLLLDCLRPITADQLKRQGDLNVIAACVDYKSDYHFYRMHQNNTWSHQRGYGGEITEFDSCDELILDPSMADRGRYRRFIGYFVLPPEGLTYAVKPKGFIANLLEFD